MLLFRKYLQMTRIGSWAADKRTIKGHRFYVHLLQEPLTGERLFREPLNAIPTQVPVNS